MNRIKLLIVSALAICAPLLAAECSAKQSEASSSVRISQFEIGFSGNYKIGCWAPVFVTIDAPGDTELVLELTVP